MPIEICNYPAMTPTRPCRYCLALQGGSVFADFDVDSNGHVYLVRISFDGYGACIIDDASRRMNYDDSLNLIKWMESDNVNHDAMGAILTTYFHDNKDIIWADALADHELLQLGERSNTINDTTP